MTSKNPQEHASWVAKRRGKITASRVGLITRRKKDGKPYAGYDDYLIDLVIERLTGVSADHYVNPAMQWGIENEDAAADFYAFETGASVAFSDFVDHPIIGMSGASPDRLVSDDGLLEIKCPTSRTHYEFWETGIIDPNYLWQMQWQMACTGRKWCDFMSYDPRFPVQTQSKIIRVERDDEMIAQAEKAVMEALAIVAVRESKLSGPSGFAEPVEEKAAA